MDSVVQCNTIAAPALPVQAQWGSSKNYSELPLAGSLTKWVRSGMSHIVFPWKSLQINSTWWVPLMIFPAIRSLMNSNFSGTSTKVLWNVLMGFPTRFSYSIFHTFGFCLDFFNWPKIWMLHFLFNQESSWVLGVLVRFTTLTLLVCASNEHCSDRILMFQRHLSKASEVKHFSSNVSCRNSKMSDAVVCLLFYKLSWLSFVLELLRLFAVTGPRPCAYIITSDSDLAGCILTLAI